MKLLLRAWTNPRVRRITYAFPALQPYRPVFVVGCYNSGTTLLRKLIGRHPDTCMIPWEGARFSEVLTRPEDLGWVRMWWQCEAYVRKVARSQPLIAERLMADWMPWICRGGILVEKSVSNVPRMGWLSANFPGARFVGISRDPIPVVEGILRRAKPRGGALAQLRSAGYESYTALMAAAQWKRSVELMHLEAASLGKGAWCHITYEDLVRDPQGIMDGVFSFLNLRPITVPKPRRHDNAASAARLPSEIRADILRFVHS